MRRSSIGKISIAFAILAGSLFVLHFTNVVPVLNTVLAPLFALLGTLLGVLGYFERDKVKLPALIGMCTNGAFLIWWIVLLVLSLSK